MSEAPYRQAGSAASGEATHCLFCGAECNDVTGACKKCGAWSAAPATDESPTNGFPCPRCTKTRERLAPESFGRSTIKVCKKCHGFFCPALQFSFIVNDYLAGVDLPLGTLTLAPPPPGSAPDLLPFVSCIACIRPMERVNFATRSSAVVDVCSIHGIWLDAGELIPILHFVKTRAELGEVPLTEAEIREQQVIDQDTAESRARCEQLDAKLALLRIIHGYGYDPDPRFLIYARTDLRRLSC